MMQKQRTKEIKPVILIDSRCKLCSKSMKFIVNHGGENKFRFYSLYSDEGSKILVEYGFPKDYDKSLVLIEKDKAYIKSDAALKISKQLNGILPLLYWLKIIPKGIRDSIYNLISHYRHKIYKY